MGNDSILDGLEEGIIIKDELTNETIYINKSARQMGMKKEDYTVQENNDADYISFVNELFNEESR